MKLDFDATHPDAGPFYAECGYREVAHVIDKENPFDRFRVRLVLTDTGTKPRGRRSRSVAG